MITPIHFEVFASGMKARLDPTYRQGLQARQHPEPTEIRKSFTPGTPKTVLPFTTISKSSGTFYWR